MVRGQLKIHKIKESKRTSSVKITWVGHPGNAPVDARARPFLVEWDESGGLLPAVKAAAIRSRLPVLRWDYVCAGVHNMVAKSEEPPHDEEVGADEIEFSDDEKEAEYKRQQKMKKKGGRGGKNTAGDDRGGYQPAEAQPAAAGLNYDDEDDDGPYRPLSRPANFGQGPPPPGDPGMI